MEGVKRLSAMGITCVMATGDNEKTARAVAARVGIGEVHAGVRPTESSTWCGSSRPGGARSS